MGGGLSTHWGITMQLKKKMVTKYKCSILAADFTLHQIHIYDSIQVETPVDISKGFK